jgi:hypothetical protein
VERATRLEVRDHSEDWQVSVLSLCWNN